MNRSIGQILVGENLLTDEQVETALEFKEENKCFLGAACIQLGFLETHQILEALAIQLYLPMVNLSHMNIDLDVLDYIPQERARELKVMPLFEIGDQLTIAVSDPQNIQVVDTVRKMTDKMIQLTLATEESIIWAIDGNYSSGAAFGKEDFQEGADAIEEASSEENIQIADSIMVEAARSGTSDVHIEPGDGYLQVRFRRDGVLNKFSTLPPSRTAGLISRFKVLAGIDIAESRKPQDGRFQQEISKGHPVDVRVSTYPTPYGEKVVMRILDQSKGVTNLDKLGFGKNTLQEWKEAYTSGNGIVLVTGPTGSGKSTTLYATLSRINTIDQHIITIEDPIEYRLNGIIQAQVNERAGMTFAAALRSMLRQDPDIIMVGEMRDRETIELAIRAALTGHLVFSTIHTNDAASTYTRLMDMGTDPFLLTTTIRAILAQRLIRKLCTKCRVKYQPTAKDLEHIGMGDYNGAVFMPSKSGCKSCGDGYSGRSGLYELLIPTMEINEVVKIGGNSEDIQKIALDQGMKTLKDAAHNYVKKGVTSIEEIARVL